MNAPVTCYRNRYGSSTQKDNFAGHTTAEIVAANEVAAGAKVKRSTGVPCGGKSMDYDASAAKIVLPGTIRDLTEPPAVPNHGRLASRQTWLKQMTQSGTDPADYWAVTEQKS